MASKAGVWIDHKQAIVILITDTGPEIKKFDSVIKQPVQPVISSRSENKFTSHDFIADDRREQKLVNGRKKMYDEVLACIRGADSLLVLGPGEAKGEFNKHITSKKLRGVTVELETSFKMSDRQIAAKVGEHFAEAPVSKSVAPKKTAKGMSGKRTKKTGK